MLPGTTPGFKRYIAVIHLVASLAKGKIVLEGFG